MRERQKKEDTRSEMSGKSQNAVFFQRICGSAGSTSRLAKVAGAEPYVVDIIIVGMSKNYTPLCCSFQNQNHLEY